MEYRFEENQIQSLSGRPFLYDFAYKVNKKKKPIIIFLHGFKGFKDWGHFKAISDYMIEQDVIFLKMNFSHNGTTIDKPLDFADLEAFGNNNFSKELQDIDSLLNHICSSNFEIPEIEINKEEIILIGHSKGGATAIIQSQDDRISKTVTWAGVLEIIERYGKKNLDEWKSTGVQFVYNGRTDQNMPIYFQLSEDILSNQKKFNIAQILENTSTPTLILHPQDDTTIPIEETKIAKQANNPLVKIAFNKGNHTLDGHHPYCACSLPEATLRACDKTLNFIKS